MKIIIIILLHPNYNCSYLLTDQTINTDNDKHAEHLLHTYGRFVEKTNDVITRLAFMYKFELKWKNLNKDMDEFKS